MQSICPRHSAYCILPSYSASGGMLEKADLESLTCFSCFEQSGPRLASKWSVISVRFSFRMWPVFYSNWWGHQRRLLMWCRSAGDVEDIRSRVSQRVHGRVGLPRLRQTATVYVSLVRRHRDWHQRQFAGVPVRRRHPDWRYQRTRVFGAGDLRRRALREQLYRRVRGTGEALSISTLSNTCYGRVSFQSASSSVVILSYTEWYKK